MIGLSGFRRYKGRTLGGWMREGFDPPPELLEHPEHIGRFPGAEHLLDCRGRQIYRLPLIFNGEDRSCFTYYFTNASLGRSLRGSYAYRSLKMSTQLSGLGFPTLEVLGAFKRRGELLNWTGLLIAGEIHGVFELPSAGRHVFQIHTSISLSSDLTASLGKYLAALHNAGFYHGDLKTRHVLVSRGPEGPVFHLVDLEKCLFLPRLPGSLRIFTASRDLVQLLASLPQADVDSAGPILLNSYLETIRLTARQKDIVRKVTGLYGKGGRFRQGRTLLANVLDLVKR